MVFSASRRRRRGRETSINLALTATDPVSAGTIAPDARAGPHLRRTVNPVLSRHITSAGELTAQGLVPQRFDGEQTVLFRPQ